MLECYHYNIYHNTSYITNCCYYYHHDIQRQHCSYLSVPPQLQSLSLLLLPLSHPVQPLISHLLLLSRPFTASSFRSSSGHTWVLPLLTAPCLCMTLPQRKLNPLFPESTWVQQGVLPFHLKVRHLCVLWAWIGRLFSTTLKNASMHILISITVLSIKCI